MKRAGFRGAFGFAIIIVIEIVGMSLIQRIAFISNIAAMYEESKPVYSA